MRADAGQGARRQVGLGWFAERAHLLGGAIENVLAQSFRDFELIVVDDGSTDATARIAAAFCAENPHARLVSTPNRGVAAARNLGMTLRQLRYRLQKWGME